MNCPIHNLKMIPDPDGHSHICPNPTCTRRLYQRAPKDMTAEKAEVAEWIKNRAHRKSGGEKYRVFVCPCGKSVRVLMESNAFLCGECQAKKRLQGLAIKHARHIPINGPALRSIRLSMGLSLEKLALRLGFNKKALVRWENGRRMSPENFQKMCHVLNIEPDVLRGGEARG